MIKRNFGDAFLKIRKRMFLRVESRHITTSVERVTLERIFCFRFWFGFERQWIHHSMMFWLTDTFKHVKNTRDFISQLMGENRTDLIWLFFLKEKLIHFVKKNYKRHHVELIEKIVWQKSKRFWFLYSLTISFEKLIEQR